MTAVREAPLIPGYSGMVEIGSGGFATVYRARREAFDQTVAVKVVHLGGAPESVRMRFDRERRALGSLAHHPHIVTVYDGGITAGGAPFLVMEYLPDGALEKQAGRLSVAEVLRIGVQLAGALETAHRSNVLHRDVKPANVLWSRYGDPVLADFGIARLAGGSRTTSGVVTASLAYAPPEVLEAKQPGPEADVWSLAATLVCLLTGRPPFAAEVGDAGTPALIARILRDEPPDLVGQGVPADVAVPLLAAMTQDPARRTRTALQFAEALQAVLVHRRESGVRPVVDGLPQRDIATEQPVLALPLPRASPASSEEQVPSTVPFQRQATGDEHDNMFPDRRRPWWQLVGASVVGLGGVTLLGVLMIAGFFGLADSPAESAVQPPVSSVEPVTPSPSPAASFPDAFVGTWSGRITEKYSDVESDQIGIRLVIPPNSTAGQIFYLFPNWKSECPGKLELRLGSTDNSMALLETEEPAPEGCGAATHASTVSVVSTSAVRYESAGIFGLGGGGELRRQQP